MPRILSGVLILAVLLGRPPPAPAWQLPSARPGRLPTGNDALALAWADLRSLPREQQLFTRYLLVEGPDREDAQALALSLAYALQRTNLPARPTGLVAGPLVLLRVNLKAYARTQADVDDLVKTWEELQFDPTFSLNLTQDTLKFALALNLTDGDQAAALHGQVQRQQAARVQWRSRDKVIQHKGGLLHFHDDSGRAPRQLSKGTHTIKLWFKHTLPARVEVVDVAAVDVLRQPAPHLDRRLVAALIDATQSQAAVVAGDYFTFRALSTIRDAADKKDTDNVYKVIWGGLYYDFKGVRKDFGDGASDEDHFLEKLGVGNVKAKFNARQFYEQLRSDKRVLVWESNIAGKRPRRVDILPTAATDPYEGQSFVGITHDIKAKRVDIGRRAFANLVTFQDDAREVITSGMPTFALFNGAGALQDVVPSDVVSHDPRVPFPHRADLQAGIGCIWCHGQDGGWKPLKNDLADLLKLPNLDIFGDLSRFGVSQEEVRERLRGQYSGNPELKLLPRGRDDYAAAILAVTGQWKDSTKAQADIVQLATAKVSAVYGRYWYDGVDARLALRHLGQVPPADVATAALELRKLLPPVRLVPLAPAPEDSRIARLLAGGTLQRSDYDLARPYLAVRVLAPKGPQ